MRTTILECVDGALVVPGHDNRHGPDTRRAIGVGLGQLDFQAEEVPRVPTENALLFALVKSLVGVDPVGHTGHALGRPFAGRTRRCHTFSSSARCNLDRYPRLSQDAWCSAWNFVGATSGASSAKAQFNRAISLSAFRNQANGLEKTGRTAAGEHWYQNSSYQEPLHRKARSPCSRLSLHMPALVARG